MSVYFTNRLNQLFNVLNAMAWGLFTQQYFQTRKMVPRFHKTIWGFLSVYLFLLGICFILPFHLTDRMLTIIGMPFSFTIMLIAMACWVKDFFGARYFFIASVLYVIISWVPTLYTFNLISISGWHLIFLMICCAFVLILFFSPALIDRYNAIEKSMLESQKKALNSMRQTEKLKDEFLANTSHELRTPLHGIIGLCEDLLARGQNIAQTGWQKEIGLVIQSGRRLSGLVDDLLDFSKIRQNELQINPRPIDFESVCSVVMMLCRPMIGQKDIKIQTDIPDSLPLVMADENRLQQILLNLVGNAIKFTTQGEVRVRAEIIPEYLEVSVHDTGIGIPIDKQETIFDQFTQVDGASNREYGGTGLGLAISKKLVELQGGSIKVSSEINKGSVFSFTLPLAKEQSIDNEINRVEIIPHLFVEPDVEFSTSTQPAPSEQFVSTSLKQTLEILIVDDDVISLQILRNHLKTVGYTVYTAQDGFQAWHIIQRQSLDLVILDVMMPRMNGYELCEKIRQSSDLTELPVIMLTARTQIDDIINGFNSGANDYLTKPVNRLELLARVQTSFQLKQLADVLRENQDLKNEIIKRKLAEGELVTANKRLVGLLDSWENAIIIVDSHQRIQFFNQKAEQLFNFQTYQIITQPLSVLFPHHSDFIPDSNLKAATSLASKRFDVSGRKADKTEFPLEVILTSIAVKGETAYALICRDAFKSAENDKNQDIDIAKELTRNHLKIQTMQNAFDGMLHFLNQEGKHLVSELRNIDQVMENDFSQLSKKEKEFIFRQTLVELTSISLDCWEKTTGKDKIQLAEESEIWQLYLDAGTYKTRTLDKYLNINTLPSNPRWRNVLNTGEFVLQTCPESHPLNNQLRTSISKLKAIAKTR
ncbi:response regulator [bacterium]|nr:response regulator [bacterium]